ncbi:hypothetical protein F5880DRAFT_1616022, partial [Lentinula raphanica]
LLREALTASAATASIQLGLGVEHVTTDESSCREVSDEIVGAGTLQRSAIDVSHADAEVLFDQFSDFGPERNAVDISIPAKQGQSAYQAYQDLVSSATPRDGLVESQAIDEGSCHASPAGLYTETFLEYHYGRSSCIQAEGIHSSDRVGGLEEHEMMIPSHLLTEHLILGNADAIGEGTHSNGLGGSQVLDEDGSEGALFGHDTETSDEYHYGYVGKSQIAEIGSDGVLEELNMTVLSHSFADNRSTFGNVDELDEEWTEGSEVRGAGVEHDIHIATSSSITNMGSGSGNAATINPGSSSQLDYFDLEDGSEEPRNIDLENVLDHYGDTHHTIGDELWDMSSTSTPLLSSLENSHFFREFQDSETLADSGYHLTTTLSEERSDEPTDTNDSPDAESTHDYDHDERLVSTSPSPYYVLPSAPAENTFPSFADSFADDAPRVSNDIVPHSTCITNGNEGWRHGIVDAVDSAPTLFAAVNEEDDWKDDWGESGIGVAYDTHIPVSSMPTSDELEMTTPHESFAGCSMTVHAVDEVCEKGIEGQEFRGVAVEHESHIAASSISDMGSVSNSSESENFRPSSQTGDFDLNIGAGRIDLYDALNQDGYVADNTVANESYLEVFSAPIPLSQGPSVHPQLFDMPQDAENPYSYGHGHYAESQPTLGLLEHDKDESTDAISDPYAISSHDSAYEDLISFSPLPDVEPSSLGADTSPSLLNVFHNNDSYSACKTNDEQGWAYGIAEAAGAAPSASTLEEKERAYLAAQNIGLGFETQILDHTAVHVDHVPPDMSSASMPLSPLSEESHLFHISPSNCEDHLAGYHAASQVSSRLSEDRGGEVMDTNDDPYALPNHVDDEEKIIDEFPSAPVENTFPSVWNDSSYQGFDV